MHTHTHTHTQSSHVQDNIVLQTYIAMTSETVVPFVTSVTAVNTVAVWTSVTIAIVVSLTLSAHAHGLR